MPFAPSDKAETVDSFLITWKMRVTREVLDLDSGTGQTGPEEARKCHKAPGSLQAPALLLTGWSVGHQHLHLLVPPKAVRCPQN